MKLLLNKVLLLVFFSAFLNASVILQSECSEANAKKAKECALSSLLSLIKVEVDSSISNNLKSIRENGVEKLSEKVEENTNIKTDGYLSGIKYEEIQRSSKSVTFRTILDDDALKKSIERLNDAISKDILNLSEKELNLLLKKSEYLLLLISYNKNIISKKDILLKRDKILKTLNMSRLTLNIVPKDSNIYINNKRFENLKTYFIKPGKHSLKVKKDGYFSVEKIFYTQKNRQTRIDLELIKKGSVTSVVNVVGADSFLADIKHELLKYDISYKKQSGYVLEFTVDKKLITEVAGTKVYSLKIMANFKHNSTLIVSKTARLKSVAEANLHKKELALIKALIKAIVKVI